jgi:hypothetical protein
MNEELCNKLYEDYPNLFVPVWRNQRAEISCGDGWYDLINGLCRKITDICEANKVPAPAVHQVKEKFGGLRFYTDTIETDNASVAVAIDDAIMLAEELAEDTCEVCGEPGHPRTEFSWVKTLCDKHTQERRGQNKL